MLLRRSLAETARGVHAQLGRNLGDHQPSHSARPPIDTEDPLIARVAASMQRVLAESGPAAPDAGAMVGEGPTLHALAEEARSIMEGADAGTSTRQRGPSSDFELEITDAPGETATPNRHVTGM